MKNEPNQTIEHDACARMYAEDSLGRSRLRLVSDTVEQWNLPRFVFDPIAISLLSRTVTRLTCVCTSKICLLNKDMFLFHINFWDSNVSMTFLLLTWLLNNHSFSMRPEWGRRRRHLSFVSSFRVNWESSMCAHLFYHIVPSFKRKRAHLWTWQIV